MSTIRVLVVDDEPGIRSGIARVLRNFTVSYPFMDEDFNYQVIEAATGEEGLDFIKNDKVDIVLLDNKLPGIQGTEVLDYISKHHYDLAVTMITSYASLDLAVAATGKGAFNFVPKPFTPAELKTAVESASKHLYLKRMTLEMNTQGREMRFKFLSVLSHELKSPLSAIEGYLNLMDSKIMGSDLEAYEDSIQRSLERIKGMRSLIMDLLDLTRLEGQEGEKQKSNLDLGQICNMALDTIQPMVIQRNINVIKHIDEDVHYVANSNDMDIIFNNLLSNAVKYNKDNGLITVHLEYVEKYVKLVVEDTGIGIEESNMDKLFEEFSRIKNEETRFISGSGLGLSILKKTVESYGGTVEVRSKYGEGSKFKVLLPIDN
jgi:two-component system sensor histidine kinase/response regulator